MATLHFPSGDTIASYLKQQPLATHHLFTDQKIINTVAAHFADQATTVAGIESQVNETMNKFGKELNISDFALPIIKVNLVQALKDCAHGSKPVIYKAAL